MAARRVFEVNTVQQQKVSLSPPLSTFYFRQFLFVEPSGQVRQDVSEHSLLFPKDTSTDLRFSILPRPTDFVRNFQKA